MKLCLSNCLVAITAISLGFNSMHSDHQQDIQQLEYHYNGRIAQLEQEKDQIDAEYVAQLENLIREKEALKEVVVKSKVIKTGVSAYTASRGETDGDPSKTATMSKPIPGRTCAVSRDLKHLLGKRIYVDGVGVREVNDLMPKRFIKSVDLCVVSKSQALDFGKTDKKIIVL